MRSLQRLLQSCSCDCAPRLALAAAALCGDQLGFCEHSLACSPTASTGLRPRRRGSGLVPRTTEPLWRVTLVRQCRSSEMRAVDPASRPLLSLRPLVRRRYRHREEGDAPGDDLLLLLLALADGRLVVGLALSVFRSAAAHVAVVWSGSVEWEWVRRAVELVAGAAEWARAEGERARRGSSRGGSGDDGARR